MSGRDEGIGLLAKGSAEQRNTAPYGCLSPPGYYRCRFPAVLTAIQTHPVLPRTLGLPAPLPAHQRPSDEVVSPLRHLVDPRRSISSRVKYSLDITRYI